MAPLAPKLAGNLLAGAHPTTSSVTHIRLVAQIGQMVQNFSAASMRIRRGSKAGENTGAKSGPMYRSFEAGALPVWRRTIRADSQRPRDEKAPISTGRTRTRFGDLRIVLGSF